MPRKFCNVLIIRSTSSSISIINIKKLFYLRDRTCKSARITEKIKKKIGIEVDIKPEQVTEENVAPLVVEKATTEAPKAEALKTEASKAEEKKESSKKKK